MKIVIQKNRRKLGILLLRMFLIIVIFSIMLVTVKLNIFIGESGMQREYDKLPTSQVSR